MNKKYIVHVVPSTHWDREWYITQQRFQVRLIRLIDKIQKLLKDDRYTNFLLDGQVIPIEDCRPVEYIPEWKISKCFVKLLYCA